MKSFADVKRRLQIGTVLECVENTYRPELNGTRRIVTKVQGNAIRWRNTDEAPDARPSWTPFPPASNTAIVDADTFQLSLKRDGHYVRLRFIDAA
jgi:hypothetical protein